MPARFQGNAATAILVLAALTASGCSSKEHAVTTAPSVPPVNANVAPASRVEPPARQNPALLPPLSAGNVVKVNLVLLDRTVEIAPGEKYRAWTFNGTVPGPVLHFRVGQTIEVTLTNRSAMGHSIDFHSALAPPDLAYQTIAPGESIHYSWVARYPGVFLYHCGTPPVLAHISNGMYGAVVVDPKKGWGDATQEYVLLQSEFYTQPVAGKPGVVEGDLAKMKTAMPDLVVFNGDAFQYEESPLPIRVGKRARVFIVNAGPSHFSAFHVVGTIFDRVLVGGNPDNELHGLQTVMIGPGAGAMVEFTVHQPSHYPFLTHSFGDADDGAMGAFLAK